MHTQKIREIKLWHNEMALLYSGEEELKKKYKKETGDER